LLKILGHLFADFETGFLRVVRKGRWNRFLKDECRSEAGYEDELPLFFNQYSRAKRCESIEGGV
jgi:hypothetical protein